MAGEILIDLNKSVIPSCDVDTLESLSNLVRNTHDVPGIGAYKVGLELVIPYGLNQVMVTVRRLTDKPVIYDHQKAGNDIPELGIKFARACRSSSVDAVILFPFASSLTEEEWIKASLDAGLHVLVGGHMTQKQFLESEGGFIADGAPPRIYQLAAELGVRDFVVPGNKVPFVEKYRALLDSLIPSGEYVLYAPGFVDQGGIITEMGKVAGPRWHAIAGRALYTSPDPRLAAEMMTSNLR